MRVYVSVSKSQFILILHFYFPSILIFFSTCQFASLPCLSSFAHEAEALSCRPPHHPTPHPLQCPSSGEILSHFGMKNLSRLSVGDLETICPAVLTQVLLPSCPHTLPDESLPIHYSGQLLHHFVCPPPKPPPSTPPLPTAGHPPPCKSNTWQVVAAGRAAAERQDASQLKRFS